MNEPEISDLVKRARGGELPAYGRVVEAMQRMVYAVVMRIVHHHDDAMDVTQEAFLRAFARLKELREDEAFAGWLRRIAVTAAQGHLRQRRMHFLDSPALNDLPVLDEQETHWNVDQRAALSQALVKLPPDDRLICERFYHGGWPVMRLAEEQNVAEPAIRKRLQRIRDRLRRDIEMSEQQDISSTTSNDRPQRIIDLLAKPTLTRLPQNPVGAAWERICSHLMEFQTIDVPEILEDSQIAEAFGRENIWSHLREKDQSVHRIDEKRFLRTEMDVPLLLAARGRSERPLKLVAAGKVYRRDKIDAMHLQAFHQGELLLVEQGLREWDFMDRLLAIVESLFPGRPTRHEQFNFPLCTRAWEIDTEIAGEFVSVLAWGMYKPGILTLLGDDPKRFGAIGVGFGLERIAAACYGIDDIRKVEAVRVEGV